MLFASKPSVTFIERTKRLWRRKDIFWSRYLNKILKGLIGLFLILIIPLTSCFKKEANLSGTVTAKDSGQPILNAQVQIEGSDFIIKTNSDGFYSFSKIPSDFRLIFKHTDFDSVVVDAVDMKKDRTYRIDVSMDRK